MGLKAGWIAFFVFVWLIGAFLGSTFEYQNTKDTWAGTGSGGYHTSPTSKLEYLMDIKNAVQQNTFLGAIPLPVPNADYFKTLGEVITWKFSFMYNPDGTMAYGMIYYIIFVPFVLMGILSLILLAYGIITGNLTI